MVETDRGVEIDFRRRLEQHPLYFPCHKVSALRIDNTIQIQYDSSANVFTGITSFSGTSFDFNLHGSVLDVLHFFVESGFRKKGHGRKFYQIIEDFARDYGCVRAVTFPSGEGREFWPKMGFNRYYSGGMAEKCLIS